MKNKTVTTLCALAALTFTASLADARPAARVSRGHKVAPHNSKGVAARFMLGGSAPTGDRGDNVDVGLRIGGAVGYQMPMTPKLSLTPQIWLNYMGWSGDNDSSASMFIFAVGAQADYFFLEDLSGWAAAHLGGGSIGLDAGNGGFSESNGGFALSLETGATYYFTEYVGAGAFFGISSCFAGENDAKINFSSTSVDFGVMLRGRYALL